MVNSPNIYDKRYSAGYREDLSGYEFARWRALDHFIRKILRLKNVKTALDYGCGNGLYVDLWKKVFPSGDLHFCDVSSVALEQLVSKYPEFKSKCAEVKQNKAPFNNNFFDVIISVEVIEHVENLNEYLNDVHRLLKQGGFFIFTTPCANRFSIEHILTTLTRQIEKTKEGFIRWKWEDPAHLRRLKSNEINNILKEIGFDRIEFRFRSHFFSFFCTYLFRGPLKGLGEQIMLLDYSLFRNLPNGASMIGFAKKE